MTYRRLGRTGFMVSSMGFGGDDVAPDNNDFVLYGMDLASTGSTPHGIQWRPQRARLRRDSQGPGTPELLPVLQGESLPQPHPGLENDLRQSA